jgi:hypothetical protein
VLAPCDSLPEVLGVPVDDDGGQQVQPCHTVVLTFDGPIADFALPPDAQGVFQGVMGLALVEANLGTTLHVGIKQPIDDEERALDAADFTQGKCQLMLAWIGCELFEQLTGRHDARSHRGYGAQDILPVLNN